MPGAPQRDTGAGRMRQQAGPKPAAGRLPRFLAFPVRGDIDGDFGRQQPGGDLGSGVVRIERSAAEQGLRRVGPGAPACQPLLDGALQWPS